MQKTPIYIDINTRSQMTEAGAFVDRTTLYPAIERGQWAIFCFTFLDRQSGVDGVVLNPVVLPNNANYLLVADNNFDDDDNLMLKSFQSVVPFDESDPESNMCNIAGDWLDGGTADPALGQLSFRINSDTVKFASVMGNEVLITSGLYVQIKQFTPGISNPSTLAFIKFKATNTIRDWSSAQTIPPAGVDYINYINAYLNHALEYEYSVDGVSWHSVLVPHTDIYFRARISDISASWSPAQLIAYGPPNPLSIGTVDSGETASASITGTPPNQLLNLSIPSGMPGPSNTLSIGTVDSGETASASITGTSPNQVLNLVLPKGDKGDASTIPGPSNTLSIGTVDSGETASASITGTSPNQVLNLVLPKGDKGDTGGTFAILQVSELPTVVDSGTLYLIG